MDQDIQQLHSVYAVLPIEIKELIADPETYSKIELIGTKSELTKVQIGLLAQVTSSLLMGVIRPNEFVTTIIDYLGIQKEPAMLIAQEINREIFNGVKDALKQLHNINNETPVVLPKTIESIPAIISPQSALAPKEPQVVSTPATPTPEKAPMNNLESKLGSAFSIKKDILFTQPGAPTPVATPEVVPPPPQVKEAPAQATNPVIPAPTAKSDLYREAV